MLPFLAARIGSLSGQAQAGFLGVLRAAVRSSQYAILVAFLTGGYLVGKAGYSVLWMILAVVLLLALTAFSGILLKRLRLFMQQVSGGGKGTESDLSRIKTFSLLSAVVFLLIIFLMVYPNVFLNRLKKKSSPHGICSFFVC